MVKSRRFGTLEQRYLARAIQQPGCWGWNGKLDTHGYGLIGKPHQSGAFLKAHRVAWEIVSGAPVPDGLDVLHTCDTRSCTRHDEAGIYVIRGIARPRYGHLWLGTQADNVADMDTKRRANHWGRQLAAPN
jgi:hypothetical protein